MDVTKTREALIAKGLKVLAMNRGYFESFPFTPLHLRALMLGEKVPCTLFVKASGSFGEDVKFAPYLKEGEVLEETWLAPLQRMGIDRLYFNNDDLDRVIAYLNNYLLILGDNDIDLIKQRLELLAENLGLSLRRAFQAHRLGPHLQMAQRQIGRLIQELQKDNTALGLVWEIITTSYNLYNHSVNVCLLSAAMMLFLKKSGAESQKMGLAALFHDVGMTRMPQEIFYKTSPLTSEEREKVEKHPDIGKRLLSEFAAMPMEGLRLILEHHENADGSGYPQGLDLLRQHPWTRILRVADTYDSLTNNGLYRPVKTPFAALKCMKQQQGSKGPVFDPPTLDNFIRFLGWS